MRILSVVAVVFAFVASCVFFNCSGNDASPVGLDFLQRANVGGASHKIFRAAPSDTFYQFIPRTVSSAYLYAGKYGAVEAKTLIRFDTATVSGSVDSLVLVFQRPRIIARITGSVTIRLNVLNMEWSDETVTWATFDPASIGTLVASKTIATTAVSDSAETLEMKLPPEWAVALVDPQKRTAPYGLIVSADPADALLQVSSVNPRSDEIEGTPAQLKMYSNQSLSSVSVIRDAFIVSMPMPNASDRLFVMNGIALRSFLRFPVPGIPKNATISRAMLTLHADRSRSFPPVQTPMGLYAFDVKDSVWTFPAVPADSSKFLTGAASSDSSAYVFNLTSFVQYWVSGKDDNNGLVLAGALETSDLTGVAIYSSQADSLLSPALEVYYTTPPDALR